MVEWISGCRRKVDDENVSAIFRSRRFSGKTGPKCADFRDQNLQTIQTITLLAGRLSRRCQSIFHFSHADPCQIYSCRSRPKQRAATVRRTTPACDQRFVYEGSAFLGLCAGVTGSSCPAPPYSTSAWSKQAADRRPESD